MYRTGALQSLLLEIQKYKIDLLAIQETRWMGKGVYDYKGYSIFYSGKENGAHEFGTAFIVSQNIKNSVIDFKPVDERICAIRLKTKFHNTWVINVHGPTKNKPDDIKDHFYQNLENIYNSLPQNDVKIIVGYFNAKIGKEEIYKGIIGKYFKWKWGESNRFCS